LKCVWATPRCVTTPLNTSWAGKRAVRGKKKACITKVLHVAITTKKKVTNKISMVNETIKKETKREGQRKAKRCTTRMNPKKGES
jgi:hypothetical protein